MVEKHTLAIRLEDFNRLYEDTSLHTLALSIWAQNRITDGQMPCRVIAEQLLAPSLAQFGRGLWYRVMQRILFMLHNLHISFCPEVAYVKLGFSSSMNPNKPVTIAQPFRLAGPRKAGSGWFRSGLYGMDGGVLPLKMLEVQIR